VSRTILVVDDDPSFVALMRSVVADRGYHVLAARDGFSGLATVDRLHEQIDLLIVDLALPELSGFEVIGAVARRPSAIKVLATTGVFQDSYLEIATSLGAHAFKRKPGLGIEFPRSEWLQTIESLLDSGSGAPAPAENYGPM
jgi:CheY-like chemotaxis protein